MTGKWVVKSKGNWSLFELVGSPRDILRSSSYRGSTFFFTKTGFSTISVEVGQNEICSTNGTVFLAKTGCN